CKTVVWLARDNKDEVKSCWDWTNGHWYGGPGEVDPQWPLDKHPGHADTPAITGALGGRSFSFNSRFWLNSNGFSISVPPEVPLYIAIDPPNPTTNIRRLCLVSKIPKDGPFYHWMRGRPHHLTYSECYANEVTNLTQFYVDIRPSLFQLARNLPDTSYLTAPVWSTWPGLRNKLDFSTLDEFVNHIRRNGTTRTVLRVGRGWESCLGEFHFSSTSFPDPKQTMDRVKSMGFNVLLRAHPFLAQKCAALYREAYDRSFLMKSAYAPAVNKMEDEMAANIDFSETIPGGAAEWWRDRLQQVRKSSGVHGFYFEYGQAYYLGDDARLEVNPNDYSRNYAETASHLGNMGSVAVGVGSSRLSMFAEMQKRSMSTWDAAGIKGVIPGVLQMGLSGYPFVLADPIGGGDAEQRPEPKLYVRWLQLATFLPSMHFSWDFWSYDNATLEIAKSMIKLRSTYSDTIVNLAKTAAETGIPMVRPLWWIAPNDARALQVDDQFLLGNDILVAPIVTEKDERDVYIPNGKWNDMVTNRPVAGPKVINAKVALGQLLYFTRIK
uniref:Glycoside hydrolase family 31 N-terminal domain-containing protein n=1 Tax=Strigamia maritima TaxID=126957 RepID=T1J1V8_STRMM